MALNLCVLGSGRSGNCIYVGSDHTHILIDAGLSMRQIAARLRESDRELESITAVCVTHEHSDHTSGLATLHRRENWGEPIHEALKVLANNTDKYDIAVITHPNWANHTQSTHMPSSLTYIDPTSREDLLNMVDHVDLIVTDSGGLQEECALMGVPCIVYRDHTERAGLQAYGSVHLVDPNTPWDLEDALLYYWNSRFVYGIPGTVSKLMAEKILEQHRIDQD